MLGELSKDEIQFNKKITLLKHQAWLAQRGKSKAQVYQDYVDKVNDVLARKNARQPQQHQARKAQAQTQVVNENREYQIFDEEAMFLASVFEQVYGEDADCDHKILSNHDDIIVADRV